MFAGHALLWVSLRISVKTKMEGTILGIDEKTRTAAIKAEDGSRSYFPLDEWKGPTPLEVGAEVDYDTNGDGQAKAVYPTDRKSRTKKGSKPPKTKTAATLFAFLLGAVGGHKFYLGSWGWGIVYLLFCWTYIPLIVSVLETIRYIVITEEQFQQKYAKANGPFGFID